MAKQISQLLRNFWLRHVFFCAVGVMRYVKDRPAVGKVGGHGQAHSSKIVGVQPAMTVVQLQLHYNWS